MLRRAALFLGLCTLPLTAAVQQEETPDEKTRRGEELQKRASDIACPDHGQALNGKTRCTRCDQGRIACADCKNGTNCKVCGGTGTRACPDPECKKGNLPCARCKGVGEFKCSGPGSCAGTDKCSSCEGDGRTSCNRCRGDGWVSISAYEGNWRMRCPECGGADRGDDVVCGTCEGTGRCTICSGKGKVVCSSCDGNGQEKCLEATCSVKMPKCGTCGGKGRRICATCKDSRRVKCPDCGGSVLESDCSRCVSARAERTDLERRAAALLRSAEEERQKIEDTRRRLPFERNILAIRAESMRAEIARLEKRKAELQKATGPTVALDWRITNGFLEHVAVLNAWLRLRGEDHPMMPVLDRILQGPIVVKDVKELRDLLAEAERSGTRISTFGSICSLTRYAGRALVDWRHDRDPRKLRMRLSILAEKTQTGLSRVSPQDFGEITLAKTARLTAYAGLAWRLGTVRAAGMRNYVSARRGGMSPEERIAELGERIAYKKEVLKDYEDYFNE